MKAVSGYTTEPMTLARRRIPVTAEDLARIARTRDELAPAKRARLAREARIGENAKAVRARELAEYRAAMRAPAGR